MTGGKGGVGKTHLVANLGVVAARRGLKTAVIDADAALAGLHVLFGLTPELHFGDVLDGATLDEALLETPQGVSLLPASSGERSLTRLADSQRLLQRAVWDELAERFDLVLIDCPPGMGRDSLEAAAAADQVVLITTPEPTALVDAGTIALTLAEEVGVRNIDVVINGIRSDRQAALAFAKLHGCETPGGPRLSLLGALPDDHNVRRAAVLSRPLVTVAPSSPAARAIDRLADALLTTRRDAVPGGGVIGFERRLRER